MHINRILLLEITISLLRRMAAHKVGNGRQGRWRDFVDMDFVEYLYRSYNIRRHLLRLMPYAWHYGYFQRGLRKFVLYPMSDVLTLG